MPDDAGAGRTLETLKAEIEQVVAAVGQLTTAGDARLATQPSDLPASSDPLSAAIAAEAAKVLNAVSVEVAALEQVI